MTTTPAQPAGHDPDDLMAIADAVGVTVPTHIGSDVAHLLTDPVLDRVLSTWALAYAQPDCTRCDDTGLIQTRSWVTGLPATNTCPECGDHR